MISRIKNKIKELDSSITGHPWKSPWFMLKAMYEALKYLVYHPIRLTVKGFPYIVNLKQTWEQNIRPKLPFGDPDVHPDVKENETTYKDYGVRFDPIMKKKGHGEDVRVKAPKYKLPQRSMQQFEAWLESSEEDRENGNFIPKSSDKKKLSNDEQNAYNGLIELHEFLKKNNGTVKVEGGELVIKIDVADKTLEEIEEQVKHCYDVLGMPHDTKMIGTIAKRLYKKSQDRGISSDKPFAKTKQQQTSPSQSRGKDVDGETGEIIQDATQQDSNLNGIKNMELIKPISNVRGEEQMSNSVNNGEFSLTNPEKFPTRPVNLQSEKRSSELQSDLISCSELWETDMSNIKDRIIWATGEDLSNVSLSTTNGAKLNPPCVSGVNCKRSEEVSRG